MALISMKSLAYAGVGIVVLFELSVAAMIAMPRVSDLYRAFYIDKTTSCWPLVVDGDTKGGKLISFGYSLHGEPSDQSKLCGWYYQDTNGTWSFGNHAVLRLAVAEPGQPFQVAITAGAFINDRLPQQHVNISVNGTPIKSVVLTSPDPVAIGLDIPASAVPEGTPYADLAFDLPDATSNYNLGISSDTRVIGLYLTSMQVKPPGQPPAEPAIAPSDAESAPDA